MEQELLKQIKLKNVLLVALTLRIVQKQETLF